MKRPISIAMIGCLATTTVALPALALGKQRPKDQQEPAIVVIQKEELPVELRLAIIVEYLAQAMAASPEAAKHYAKEYGLPEDSTAFLSLPELYGDLPSQSESLQPIERSQKMGQVLGMWLSNLDSEGRSSAALVKSLLNDQSMGYSMGFEGGVTTEELEERSRHFGEGFDGAHVAPLRSVLENGGER